MNKDRLQMMVDAAHLDNPELPKEFIREIILARLDEMARSHTREVIDKYRDKLSNTPICINCTKNELVVSDRLYVCDKCKTKI